MHIHAFVNKLNKLGECLIELERTLIRYYTVMETIVGFFAYSECTGPLSEWVSPDNSSLLLLLLQSSSSGLKIRCLFILIPFLVC